MEKHYQIAVIGGGINGVGVAREAAARGYSTLLVEKNDYAHATSSQSSKMIHGGIRYLEYGHFGLVRESLKERRILLQTAPHLVKPLRINIPVFRGDKRPPWMIWIGCKMYDIFAGKRNLAFSRMLTSSEVQALPGLRKSDIRGILRYSDGQVLDSRLVLETALSAESYGATSKNYTELIDVKGGQNSYQLTFLDKRTGSHVQTEAQFIVNAAGPWVPSLDKIITRQSNRPGLKYVRGIHFVVKSIGCDTGFLIMPPDGRVVFVLPWQKNYTLIGTTESVYEGTNFDKIPTSDEEVKYLLEVFNGFFPERQITLDQVLHMYSGVRTLVTMGEQSLSAISREYRVEKELLGSQSGYVAIFGGKLTTYRSLACNVIDMISPNLAPRKEGKYDTEIHPLFGGFVLPPQLEQVYEQKLREAGVGEAVFRRWQDFYGSQWLALAEIVLESADNRKSLVFDYFLMAELVYLVKIEQVHDMEDLILRRTKIGYDMNASHKEEMLAALNKVLKK